VIADQLDVYRGESIQTLPEEQSQLLDD